MEKYQYNTENMNTLKLSPTREHKIEETKLKKKCYCVWSTRIVAYRLKGKKK